MQQLNKNKYIMSKYILISLHITLYSELYKNHELKMILHFN